MSKSKRNTVDPDDIIAGYGADTARWFMLSDSPPDRDVIWTEEGVQGAWRFVQRLWRLVNRFVEIEKGPVSFGKQAEEGGALAIRQVAHRRLKRVEDFIERLNFNTAVAQIYEFAAALAAVTDPARLHDGDALAALREAYEMLVRMVAPMMPHLAEECWAALGREGLVSQIPWPKVDPELLVEAMISLPVQVNGKKKADISVPRDAGNPEIEAAVLALDAVQRALDGRPVRKIIVVPQRIVNVVG
jgi:leucyl-tRNA synthetase